MNEERCRQLIDRGGWHEDAVLGKCCFPIGPRNTYSNIAYILMAIFIIWFDYKFIEMPTFLGKISFSTIIMALSMTMLGIGSTLYHGTKRVWAQKLDNSGMYAVFTSLVIFGVVPSTSPVLAGLMAVMSGFLAWRYTYKLKGVPLDDMMGLLLAISLLRPLFEGNRILALIAFSIFGLSYISWQLDKRGGKIVGLMGHAYWHIGTAIAIALTYLSQVPLTYIPLFSFLTLK